MHDLEPITTVAAVAAVLAAASGPAGDGQRYVSALFGGTATATDDDDTDKGLPARMPVTTAVKMIRGAADNAGTARIGWAPDLDQFDGYGLVILDGHGGMYRFAGIRVADTALDTEPGTVVRPDLRVVPSIQPAAG